MFHSGKSNNWINKLHETALRIVYQDDTPSYTKLFMKYNSATIHKKDYPTFELFKAKNGLSPPLWARSLWKTHNIITWKRNWIEEK